MKNLIKLVDYTNCSDCSSLVKTRAFCKKCEKNNKFYSYKFNKEGFKKKDKLTTSKTNYAKLNIVYYVSPKEVNTTIGLQLIRFSSIEDIAAYLVYSNEFPISELTKDFSYDFQQIPQIKHLIGKISTQMLTKPPVISPNNASSINNQAGLEELVKLEFWTRLFRIYILEFHIYFPFFPLKDLDLSDTSHPLLIAIYCYVFQHESNKSQELIDYMENLEKRNLKRVQFKPCLSSIHALFIHYRILCKRGEVKKGEAVLSHLTRMCYSLGIHLDSCIFEKDLQYSRNMLFNIIISSHATNGSIYNPDCSLEYHKPSIKVCDDLNLQLLPQDLRKLLNFADEEWFRISELCLLNYRYLNQAISSVNFSQSATQDSELESYFYIQYSNWTKVYENVMEEYKKINFRYKISPELSLYEDMITINYLRVSLLIMEYWRFKSTTSQIIINETFETSMKLLKLYLNDEYEQISSSICYFSGFTLLSICRYIDKFKKDHVGALLQEVLNTKRDPLIECNLLYYSVLISGLKSIKS